MQTDIRLEYEVCYPIFDAKYYAARSAETALGWPDLAKQMFYEKALCDVVDASATSPATIDNIFMFPSIVNNGLLTQAGMTLLMLPDGNPVGWAFSSIRCHMFRFETLLAIMSVPLRASI